MRILFSKDTMISPISCREEGMLYLLFLVLKEKVLLTPCSQGLFHHECLRDFVVTRSWNYFEFTASLHTLIWTRNWIPILYWVMLPHHLKYSHKLIYLHKFFSRLVEEKNKFMFLNCTCNGAWKHYNWTIYLKI